MYISYCNEPKFLDKQVLENSVDPDPQGEADQGLRSLPFLLHLLDTLPYGKTMFKFADNYSNLLIFQTFTVFTTSYRNVPKFSDRQVWGNSADPDQTASRGAV